MEFSSLTHSAFAAVPVSNAATQSSTCSSRPAKWRRFIVEVLELKEKLGVSLHEYENAASRKRSGLPQPILETEERSGRWISDASRAGCQSRRAHVQPGSALR